MKILEYNIDLDDIFNMDEKGIMLGLFNKVKVIVPKDELQHFTIEPTNWEWVSLIECIGANGKVLKPWIIFKCKQIPLAW